MENVNLIVNVNVGVSNLSENIESKNMIKIFIDEVIQELIEDESGVVTLLEYYGSPLVPPNSCIRLHPRSLTQDHLSQLLRDQQVTYCEYLGQAIAREIDYSLANDDSLRQPVFVTVKVNFLIERRLILPPVVSAPRGASAEVLHRLVEEQRVESMCSICIENLSGNIIRMPECSHMFHQDCLFEWLGRQNSCPLCRKVPYEEETQILAKGSSLG